MGKEIEVRMASSQAETQEVNRLFRALGVERNWEVDTVIDLPPEISTDIVAFEEGGKIVAALRLVHGSAARFPIKKEEGWPDLLVEDNGTSAEVALSVVIPEYRGDTSTFLALYCAMYWETKRIGVEQIYAILDPTIFILYRRVGFRFRRIEAEEGGGEKIYWNEMTFPAVLDLATAYQYIQDRKPSLWSLLQKSRPRGEEIDVIEMKAGP